jgi:hypothetical protein
MRRHSPWAVLSVGALLLALVGAYSEFRNPPGGDPASLLYAAGRILDGARLYTDLIDLNPPFTFLFHLPVVAASRLLHLDVISCFRAFVCGLVILSGAVLYLVLRHSRADAGTRHALAAAFLLGSLGLVVGFFGEREHIQLVLVMPYLALASLRAVGAEPSAKLSRWTGVLAGIGLALKVTSGMVPLLVAGVLWFGARRRSGESFWALATLGCCTGLGLLWAPAYLATVGHLGGFYRGFAQIPYHALLTSPAMLWALVVAPLLLVIALPVMRFHLGSLVWYAGVAGFALSAMVQGKGFSYHYYPVWGCTIGVLMLVLASATTRPGKWDALRRSMAGAALLLMTAVPALVAWNRWDAPHREVDEFSGEAFDLLRDAPAGTTVAVQSSRLGDPFPTVLLQHLTLTGRFPHLWFLYPYDSSAVYHSRGVGTYNDTALSPLERELRHDVALDMASDKPALMLVRDSSAGRVVMRYLCDDSLFRGAARSYRPVRAAAAMQLYQRDTTMHSEGACGSL